MKVTRRARVTRMTATGAVRSRADVLAGEEPLEIRVGGRSFSVTMRTPGDDFALAVGFLFGEGVIAGWQDVEQIDYSSGIGADGIRDYNVVDVTLASGVPPPDPSLERHVYTSSSCGICGTASIEAVRRESHFDIAADQTTFGLDQLLALPQRLRQGQQLFDSTGGVHAAGIFTTGTANPGDLAAGSAETDALASTSDPTVPSTATVPELVCLREDVGRHNAVDKAVGHLLRDRPAPLAGAILQVSGRASFELVQKAAMAGIPVLSAVSAPSGLAVELASEVGMTLVGFNRGESLNVYAGAHRILPSG